MYIKVLQTNNIFELPQNNKICNFLFKYTISTKLLFQVFLKKNYALIFLYFSVLV